MLGVRTFSSASESDPYKILGVDRNASQEEIKKAYKKQAMEWHPDRQPPEKREEAQKRFSQVANAYETLSDPNKRQMYDLGGGMGQSGPSHPGSYSNNQAAAEELFRQVFGSSSFREMMSGLFFQNGAFLRPGSIVKVSPDRNLVVASCRKAGIDSTNDALRLKALGKAGRVTKVDHDDNTVKIRVAGVEKEVWFPAEVLQQDGQPGGDPFAAFGGFNFEPFSARGFDIGGMGPRQGQSVEQRVVKRKGKHFMQIITRTTTPDGRIREDVKEIEIQ